MTMLLFFLAEKTFLELRCYSLKNQVIYGEIFARMPATYNGSIVGLSFLICEEALSLSLITTSYLFALISFLLVLCFKTSNLMNFSAYCLLSSEGRNVLKPQTSKTIKKSPFCTLKNYGWQGNIFRA